VVRVQRPDAGEMDAIPSDAIVVGFLSPLGDPNYVKSLADHKLTGIAMELIPRTTRAQAMDAMSSQSSIAGYKAVLIAACELPRLFPMMTTAAGTVPPAKVLILGAGVAGLQAIATARRLGAVVSAYDTRPVVKEQVKSLGAEFVEIDLGVSGDGTGGYARQLTPEELALQQKLLGDHMASKDVIITTALVPGRKAPLLIPCEVVRRMKPGSVIVDLAAETGGNCELTVKDEIAKVGGVTIVGLTNLSATAPFHASQLYARNIVSLLSLLVTKEGALNMDFSDDIISAATITFAGDIRHQGTRQALGLPEEGAAK
jgi:NAD(P) transhydrogenase subunit alpha